MSFAARNALTRAGICTLGDLAARDDADLLGIRQFGAARFAELRAVLRKAAKS